MRNRPIVFVLIVVIVVAIAYFTQRSEKSKPKDISFTTSGEDSLRLANLGLRQTSVQAARILNTDKLVYPKIRVDNENVDYLPPVDLVYIVHIKGRSNKLFKKDDLWKIFDLGWRKKYEASDMYGRDAGTKKWTYVIAGDSPEEYDSVMIAINLLTLYNTDSLTFNKDRLQAYLNGLRKKIADLSLPLEIVQSEPVTTAVERAKALVLTAAALERDEIIVLRSSSTFKGKKIWDVLTGLGLRWGDGDLFHWDNPYDYGDDAFFSVWTTTDPGYFLPEDIQNDRMNPADVIFGFSAGRSADPKHVLEIMAAAAQYCQRELGGILVDADEKPFNLTQQQKTLDAFIDAMKQHGFVPGSPLVLQMTR